jgi:hypothetical protein
MKDISAVAWLPLPAAILKLSYPLEKLFLRHVGRQALQNRRRDAPGGRRKRKARKSPARNRAARSTKTAAKKTAAKRRRTKKR